MKDPYKRCPTRPIPRVELPPVSQSVVPEPPPTLVPCPACNGGGLLSHEERQRLLTALPKLGETRVETPEDEPKEGA